MAPQLGKNIREKGKKKRKAVSGKKKGRRPKVHSCQQEFISWGGPFRESCNNVASP